MGRRRGQWTSHSYQDTQYVQTCIRGRFTVVAEHSAQQADLYVLIAACVLAKDKSATIYTDFQYAYGVAHDVRALWKVRGYIT